MARVAQKFLLDVGAMERLATAAAQVRLALLDEAPAAQARADMTGVVCRIRIFPIDHVADFYRKTEDCGIAHRFIGERIEPDVAAHETGGDAIGRAEFRRIAVHRPLLVRERLPQAVHRCFRDLANQRFDLVGAHAARREAARAVDVRMDHGAARIRLEGQRLQHPAFPEIADERRIIAVARVGEAVEDAVNAFEHGARTDESRASEQRGAQARLRRPARMQALGPRAFGKVLDDPARHAAGGPQRIDELPLREPERRADPRRGRHRTEHGGRMEAGAMDRLGHDEAQGAERLDPDRNAE